MKKIKLSGKKGRGKFAIVDDEDFDRLNKYKWYFGRGYALRCEKRKPYQKGRGVLNYFGDKVVDHINGDGLDNRKNNLRIVTRQQNRFNSKTPITSASGYKGISWRKNRSSWSIYITVSGKTLYIGSSRNLEDAKNKYNEAAKKYVGKFARLHL